MSSPSAAFFDVWVIGPVLPPQHDPKKRAELLQRIEALHPVAKPDGAQFVAGARLRVQKSVDQETALRFVAELQAVGATVELEANRRADEAILALDQVVADAAPEASAAPRVDEALLAQLQSLDGDEAQPPLVDARAPSHEPVVVVDAVAPAVPEPLDDRRFRPSGDELKPMDLQIERPPPPISPPPPVAADDAPPSDAEVAPAVAEPTWRPIPGRIANGALRNTPPLRIAIGLVAGLALGWMFSQPYAHRAERRVAELRAQADAERYRPVDEAQQRVRALDAEADDTASNGALGMAVIWVLVGGGAFAAWWRFT